MARRRKLPDGMVERKGRRGYYADFRIGGRRVQKKLGTNLEAAKSILNELKARAERADFGLLDNDCSLAELREAYLKRCRQEMKPQSVKGYETALQSILSWLDVHKVSQLDVGCVLAYREEKLKRISPRRINYQVNILRSMLRWGVKQKLIGSNPLESIKPLRRGFAKEGRSLSDDEVKRLLEASKQPWRDIWYALLVTGMRAGELAQLTFTDIDWEARELIIRSNNTKNSRGRRIPIDDGLYAILQKQAKTAPSRQPGTSNIPRIAARIQARFTREHVFVTGKNTPLSNQNGYWAFMRCCKQAGIQVQTFDTEGRLMEHLDVHGLRRTFATNAIVNGADPKSVQELLGHRTLEMTMKIYAKVKAHSKRAAVAKLSYAQGATPPDHVLPLVATGG